MRILKSFGSVLCTLLALVLFSLTVSITMASPNDCANEQERSISKKGTASTNSENQLPYEEKETEKDDEPQNCFTLTCFIPEPIFLLPLSDQIKCCEKAQRPIYLVADLPLYLSKRVLLI